jgi:hypothetical protein
MTGYKPNSSPWVHLIKEDVMYPGNKVLPVLALIKDGSRIGLTDDFPVALTYDDSCVSCSTFVTNLTAAYWRCKSELSRSAYKHEWLTCHTDINSGSADVNNVPSIFILNGHNISLSPPRLTFELPPRLYMHDNTTYTSDDMQTICQPDKTYQWGFSFLALLAFCVTTMVHAIIMYSLLLRTYLYSRKHRAGQSLGRFRAVMDFTDALKAQVGEDCTDKTEKQLVDLANSHGLGIGCNDVEELPPPRRSLT